MLEFITNCEEFQNELLNEVKLFFYDLDCEYKIEHFAIKEGEKCVNTIKINGKLYEYCDDLSGYGEKDKKRYYARFCKRAVYNALKSFTGKSSPWGSLTGIRPTKIGYEYLKSGGRMENIPQYLSEEYGVSEEKSRLIYDIITNQSKYISTSLSEYNFYAHIPFCTSKCSYCSFTTFLAKAYESSMGLYCDLLVKEIEEAFSMRQARGERVFSSYVGGGTPTALDADNLYKVLSAIKAEGREFTCEAGRPDTVTKEKLEAMKACGVTRVCVNPQSFNDKTLTLIGRNHTIADFYDKYELVKSYGFDINVDLIAGLPGENVDDFINSVNKAIELMPENLTVHTLSRKNGSQIKNNGKYDNFDIEKMIEYSSAKVVESGYLPYYLYRQKAMLGNLENTGYCLKGKQCVNNITTMEETLSVEACGAGAISKQLYDGGERIERLANVRDVKLYIEQFEERLEKKKNFLLND